MNKYEINYSPSYDEWNSFLKIHDQGNFQQSYEYGETTKLVYPNTKIIRLMLKSNGTSVGLVQGKYFRPRILSGPLIVEGVHGTGPVVAEGPNKVRDFKKLIYILEKFAAKKMALEGIMVGQPGMSDVLKNSGYKFLRYSNTYKIEIDKNIDKIWERIAPNKRTNIKEATKKGIEITHDNNREHLISFGKLLKLTSDREGFQTYPFNFFIEILKIFGKNGKAKVLTACLSDQPVAAIFVLVKGDTAHCIGTGSNQEIWSEKTIDLLHWKAIELSCQEGLSHYNIGTVSTRPDLWKWKKEWNGKLEEMPIFHKVYLPKFKKFLLDPYQKINVMIKKP